MRIIETQIDVAASASSLWQILTDFPAYSDWNPFITSARSPRFEKIEVAGVAFVIQGLAVIEARGERRVDLPHYLRDGRRLPTFCLPEELVEPVGRLVLDAYRESAGRVA